LIYFGENKEYILGECETCKCELYLEKSSVAEETAYLYKLAEPVKCVCGCIDEYINKAKKSCYSIRQELLKLSDLLHRRQSVSERINEINMEMSKKVKSPPFARIFIDDILFSLRIFGIIIAAALGIEILLFIITCLMFFVGLAVPMPDVSKAGNGLFYHLNIFKNGGGSLLSKIGLPKEVPALIPELAEKQLVLDYIPYAITGLFVIIFYVFIVILAARLIISGVRAGVYASRVVNQKYSVNQKKEEYDEQLNNLMQKYQDLTDQINAQTILSNDYKNSKAVDTMLRYFLNNRVDTLREAVNLYHGEDMKTKTLEYQKAIFAELRQTRRYAKALYILSSDDNARVDAREETAAASEPDDANMSETLKNAFNKLRKTSTARIKAESSPTQVLESKTSASAPPNSAQDEQDNPKIDAN
jgi:hypothetical protein